MAGISRLRTGARSLARIGFSPSRSFGAAALQYDYEEEEDEYSVYRDRLRMERMADSYGSMAGRGVHWVVIGNPSVEKHVYAGRLSKLLEVPHISMGTLVRQELNPRSSLYKQIANAVNEGKLVPEDIIFGLLSKRLEDGFYRGEMGFILDGIPRTRIQAEVLDQIADIDLVVNFKCGEECFVKKHPGSGICSHCGESFNMSTSESSGLNPYSHHSQLKSSATFLEDAREEKVRIYSEQSKPLEDYYRKQKKLLDFQVAGGPTETWQGLLAALELQHMDGDNSSQKLTA
ncbi:P-loop containing nucleoside triphosphate hydrolases superfamily protein isoform X1 [Tasmannia lanceolata]|uniref:P-loop containing nucleoside triphosphate hydrolases superfamily protein isoform X1 n=1 Tax=Tasmannia lanceolata TaxID=3420 RepID=UPI0040648EEB